MAQNTSVDLQQTEQPKMDDMLSKKQNKTHLTKLNDVQHVLEKYFTEIEDCCTAANNGIDGKFQEIISQLTLKQKQLHQQINEWKLNKLQNINKEIENITKYQDDNDSNIPKQYGNTSDLLQHIQSLTPLIAIEFNDIKTHQISSLATIKHTNYICYPTILLRKPSQFSDKNDGYCVKLQWNMKNYAKAVCKDDIIIKYKADQKENDDDSERWKYFKHGTISITKHADDILMETQTLNVLKWNVSYLCRVEYRLKQPNEPMNVNIASNIDTFVNIKQELCKQFEKIPLQYYSHRGHSLTRHPKHLLFSSDTKQYWSGFIRNFTDDETDWIIFKYKEDDMKKKWIPKQIVFKNYKSKQDVKKMKVYVGDTKSKQWHALTQDVIQPKLSKELQYFEIDDISLAKNAYEQYKFIKLEFLENFGESNPDMCRFCCRYFSLMGLR